jgi:hypothetical protein
VDEKWLNDVIIRVCKDLAKFVKNSKIAIVDTYSLSSLSKTTAAAEIHGYLTDAQITHRSQGSG